MDKKQYELMKLQIQLFDEHPHEFDVSELELKAFELDAMITNLTAYYENTDVDEMSTDELDIMEKAMRIIRAVLIERRQDEILTQIETARNCLNWCVDGAEYQGWLRTIETLEKELEELE